ncbi:MAG TPA: alpha-ketoglutarate-dependent dioxygenase AlkB [Iamia sp.]|nr:alpha-ketoglutarate-dependent dioxygenase AlkB [Iamia sp.]
MPPELVFQPSLLAGGAPTPDPTFATAERIDLGAGAWVDHVPGWLGGADDLFTELVDTVRWRQREVAMYGDLVVEPRLTAWWGDEEQPDRRLESAPAPLLQTLLPALDGRYQRGFDAIGLNLYRNGRDSVAWHGDRYERDRPATVVAVLSLGSPRRFLLRPVGGGASRAFELHSGDLLVMGGTCQHTWQHCVPKVARAGPRMSATFRRRIHPADMRGREVVAGAA